MNLDAYIRVSDVRGRAGERFISPAVQRERIEEYVRARGHAILVWHEELDVSGRKMKRKRLQQAIQRVERGESDGIIVARLDRFARSLAGALDALQRIEAAGGKLISVEDQFDTSTAMGRFALQVLLALAELESGRIADNWRAAQGKAVEERKIHLTPHVPLGYRRDETPKRGGGVETGPLEVDPVKGPVVRELFRMRARGADGHKLAAYLNGHGIRTSYGNVWTPATVRRIFKNRVYLGEARGGGGIVLASAHEKIVTEDEWRAAQREPRVATHGEPRSLLAGLIRCAGCRYAMTHNALPDGRRRYKCRVEHPGGRCPTPAVVSADLIEPHVVDRFFKAIEAEGGGPLATIVEQQTRIEPLREALERADAELAAWRDDQEIISMDKRLYLEGLRTRLARRDERQDALTEAIAETGTLASVADPIGIRDVWDDATVVDRRAYLVEAIDAVFLRRGRASVTERSFICWRGEAPAGLPRRARRDARVVPFAFPDDEDGSAGVATSDDVAVQGKKPRSRRR